MNATRYLLHELLFVGGVAYLVGVVIWEGYCVIRDACIARENRSLQKYVDRHITLGR